MIMLMVLSTTPIVEIALAEDPPYDVRGNVEFNGFPVSNAEVRITNLRTDEYEIVFTEPDGDYIYDISNLPSGYDDDDMIHIVVEIPNTGNKEGGCVEVDQQQGESILNLQASSNGALLLGEANHNNGVSEANGDGYNGQAAECDKDDDFRARVWYWWHDSRENANIKNVNFWLSMVVWLYMPEEDPDDPWIQSYTCPPISIDYTPPYNNDPHIVVYVDYEVGLNTNHPYTYRYAFHVKTTTDYHSGPAWVTEDWVGGKYVNNEWDMEDEHPFWFTVTWLV